MTFEDVLDKEKNELIESFLMFGEGKRLNKVLADLEKNRPDLYKFYQAGQQTKDDELKALLAGYKQHTQLHTNDEFNRGWVSAFGCVVEDLEKLLK